MLEDSDLLTAVEKISQQIAPQSLTATVQVEGNQRRLSSELEHHLLRVVQEALNNIVKHAKASRAEVKLRYGETEIEVAISDDGCGFSPEQVKIGGLGHFGLRSLRSRVAKLGGVLDLNSVPGKGTTIRVTIPISTS
jgi:two-component system sensor histidine kinase DegS